jgi:hypothetical protein
MGNLFWLTLAIVGWAMGLVGLLALMRMAGDEDRAAGQQEQLLYPFSDGMVAQPGVGRFVRVQCATGRDHDAIGRREVWRLEWPSARQASPTVRTRVPAIRSGDRPRTRQAGRLDREGTGRAEQAREAVMSP